MHQVYLKPELGDVIEWSVVAQKLDGHGALVDMAGRYLVATPIIAKEGPMDGKMVKWKSRMAPFKVFIPFGSIDDPEVYALAALKLICGMGLPCDGFQYTLGALTKGVPSI